MTFYNASARPKTLMELLLAKKIEAASAEGGSSRRLFRTDSMDSVSSIGSCTSSMLGEDVCRCDDCLLGIGDLYIIPPHDRASHKKKVTGFNCCRFISYCIIKLIRVASCNVQIHQLSFLKFHLKTFVSQNCTRIQITSYHRLNSNLVLMTIEKNVLSKEKKIFCIFIAKYLKQKWVKQSFFGLKFIVWPWLRCDTLNFQ